MYVAMNVHACNSYTTFTANRAQFYLAGSFTVLDLVFNAGGPPASVSIIVLLETSAEDKDLVSIIVLLETVEDKDLFLPLGLGRGPENTFQYSGEIPKGSGSEMGYRLLS